jgi:hypothetical protein
MSEYGHLTGAQHDHADTVDNIPAVQTARPLSGRWSEPARPQPKQAGTGFAVTALVTGIVSTFFWWVPVFGLALPALAIIFGGIGLTKTVRGKWAHGKGMDIGGLCLGIVTAAVGLLWTVGVFAALTASTPASAATAQPKAAAVQQHHKHHHHKAHRITPQVQPAPAAIPAGMRQVMPDVWANGNTSDAFAENIVASYPGSPGTAMVYSPVTGQTYLITYAWQGAEVAATGGNNVYVQFPQ